jgi:adenylate cyclase
LIHFKPQLLEGGKMKTNRSRPYQLAKELSQLFVLDCKIDTVLSASMYYLNDFMGSERTSVFVYQPWNQELTVFSSLDLKKHEISIPKSSGISGWVYDNRKPVIVDNAYEDSRFCSKVDEMTGFYTTNMICTPIIDQNDRCLGTLQSLTKKAGPYTSDDIELMNLAAHMVAISIDNNERYKEITNTNTFQKKIIYSFMKTINTGNLAYAS